MKITGIETIILRVNFNQPLVSAMGAVNFFTQVLVRVETDEGIEGYGESWANYPSWTYLERQATINEGIAPLLRGQEIDDWNRVLADVFRRLERPVSQWGGQPMICQALSGIDQAVWDIRGKLYGVPVCRLLGGGLKKVPVYCSGLGPENVAGDAEKYLSRGVRAFKLKVGIDPERDRRNVLELRRAIGEECLLMVDANQGWAPDQAGRMLGFLEDQGVYWLEEPVVSKDYRSMAGIRSKTDIYIAGGENYYGRDFADALRADALDILQPDVTKCGGITEMVRICNMAGIWSKMWAPHYFGGALGLAATLQVMGAVPEGLMLEYPHDDPGFRNGILETRIEVEDGMVEIPSGPGLGVVLDRRALAGYRVN